MDMQTTPLGGGIKRTLFAIVVFFMNKRCHCLFKKGFTLLCNT